MNVVKTVFLALGAIFALVLIGIGIFGYLITGPAPLYEGPPVEVSDEAIATLDNKVQAFEQDVAQASPGDVVTLVVTEEEATSKVNQLAEEGELPLEMNHVQIHFANNAVYGSAMVDLLINMQVSTQAEVGVDEGGRPEIVIRQFNFGRLGIPRTLVDNVMVAVMKRMAVRLESLPFEFQQITIGNGEITIRAQVE